MKKLGFTLAEMIIAIAVVGAVATVSVPLVNSIIPDNKKVKVLKSYKRLTEVNQEILSDSSIYIEHSECEGLGCVDAPVGWAPLNENIAGLGTLSGNLKYVTVLADYFNATPVDIESGKTQGSFRTTDGILWIVVFEQDVDNENIINIEVTIDIDTNNETSQTFAENPNNPDSFKFLVDTSGNVFGGDSLTTAYLMNPNKLSDRKQDYQKAHELASSSD